MKPENAPRLRAWMTATEVAEFFGVTRTTVNEMIRSGEFKTLHVLGLENSRPFYTIKRTEVEKMAESREFPRSNSENSEETD